MSKITKCSQCGGNIVEPAYPGDGAYPVEPMCRCGQLALGEERKAPVRRRDAIREA